MKFVICYIANVSVKRFLHHPTLLNTTLPHHTNVSWQSNFVGAPAVRRYSASFRPDHLTSFNGVPKRVKLAKFNCVEWC